MSAWVWVAGLGATAFFVRLPTSRIYQESLETRKTVIHADSATQGRAALVALRRSGGGAGALGRSFYKGGFEPKMTRKEAALILEMPYVCTMNLQA
jgi:DnaJ family protein C protein 19